MTKTIVFLGAGLAAIPIIRQVLKTIVLPSSEYKVVLVAPNTHFHWPIAMPRVIVPGQMPNEKVFISLEERFKEYPASKYEHVVGKAGSLDPDSKTVTVELINGGTQSVSYDYLVIATGSAAKDEMPWKLVDTVEKTKEVIETLRTDIKKANKIVVAGGGATGAEIAGELGFEYGKSGAKEIYYVYSSENPLPALNENVQKVAKSVLEDLKVKLIPNTYVSKVTKNEKGETVLELKGKDGNVKSFTADTYLPAIGVTPNSSFAPKRLLDAQGYIKQTKTLQAEGYDNIWVVGDVGSLEASKGIEADAQGKHLVKALKEVIVNKSAAPEYTPTAAYSMGVTLGRSKGTGQMNGWKIPSFLIWFIKGRALLTDRIDSLFV